MGRLVLLSVALLLAPAAGQGCDTGNAGGPDPFIFYSNRNSGNTTQVPGVLDAATGMCIYPGAVCGANDPEPCCESASWIKDKTSLSSQINSFGGVAIFLLFMRCVLPRARESVQQDAAANAAGAAPIQAVAGWQRAVFGLAMAAEIFMSIYMAEQTQMEFSLSERNAMLAADAFLTPVQEVFMFLEDAVSVRVGIAVGAGDMAQLRVTSRTGFFGGLVLGSVAAGLMTLFVMSPALMQQLLVPSDRPIPGCGLLPDPSAVVRLATPYWLIISWTWPFRFAGKALNGVFLGSRNLLSYGLTGFVAQAVYFLWVVVIGFNSLEELAWANFTRDLIFFAGTGLAAARFIFASEAPVKAEEPEADDDKSSTIATVIEGFQVMLVHLCLQLGTTIGIYLTAQQGPAQLYQVSSVRAILPQYSSWPTMFAFFVRMMGSILVGRGLFRMFRKAAQVLLVMALIFTALAVSTLAPFLTPMAFKWSSQACVYASSAACVQVYKDLYANGGESIQNAFEVYPIPALVGSTFLNIAMGGLYACLDFAFMAKVSLAVFCIVYVPAVLVAAFVVRTPQAILASMFLQTVVQALIFGWRLDSNTRKMVQGLQGPWTQEGTSPEREAPLVGQSAASRGASELSFRGPGA